MRNAKEPNGFEPNRMPVREYIAKISHPGILDEFERWAHHWNGGFQLDFEGWHQEFHEWFANGCPGVDELPKAPNRDARTPPF